MKIFLYNYNILHGHERCKKTEESLIKKYFIFLEIIFRNIKYASNLNDKKN
jgi:hypothetical protein